MGQGRQLGVAVLAAAIGVGASFGCTSTGHDPAASGPAGSSAGGVDGSWRIEGLSLPASPADRGMTRPDVRFGWQDGDRTFLVARDAVLSSTDGRTWTSVLTPPAAPRSGNGVTWSIAEGLVLGDRMLVVGSSSTPPDRPPGTDFDLEADTGIRPAAWLSTDRGTSWHQLASPAFDRQGEVSSVASTPVGLVAAGAYRPHGSTGPFEPAAWTSTDAGETWSALALDGQIFDGDSSIGGVAVLGDQVVLSGKRDSKAMLWASADLRGWEDVTGPVAGEVRVRSTGSRLVAMSSSRYDRERDSEPVGWVTTDLHGWEPIARDPAVFGDASAGGAYASFSFSSSSVWLSAWGGQFYARGSAPTRSDPQFCFQDLATCQSVTSFVARSADGTTWQRVAAEEVRPDVEATSFISLVEGSDPVAVVARHHLPAPPAGDGARPTSRPATPDDLQLWRWSAPGAPAGIVSLIPSTTTPALPMLDGERPDLAVGEVRRVAWFTGGCGGGFGIGGREFVVAPPGLPEPGPDWPVRTLHIADGPSFMVLGTLTRTGQDELRFDVEGIDVSVRLVPGQNRGCL